MVQATVTTIGLQWRRISFISVMAMMLFLWSSCNNQSQKQEALKLNELMFLTNALEASTCAYLGNTGIEGKENYFYNSYKRLSQIAPDSLFIQLTESKNHVARYYGYAALKNRKYKDLDKIAEQLKKDTTSICFSSGCISSRNTISFLVSNDK